MAFPPIELPHFWYLHFLGIIGLVVLAILLGKIDIMGGIVGGIISTLVFLGGGWSSLSLIVAFFILGTASSQWKIEYKVNLGLAQANRGKRSLIHVISNAGIAGTCGLIAWLLPDTSIITRGMIAATMASATADTVSSELGNLYGTRFINCISLKKDVRGYDGVISLEGTLFGFIGSSIIGLLYGYFYGINEEVFVIVGAGVLGNYVDSLLGATLQRKELLNNHEVNFLNTLFAALFYAGLFLGVIS